MLAIYLIFVTMILYLILKYYKDVIEFNERRKILMKLPGPPTNNNMIGNIIHLITTPEKMFSTLREFALSYYPVYNIWVSVLPAACIVGPEDAELLLSNIKHINKSWIYNLTYRWLKTGLLTSNDEKWHARRKILTPAFHFNILKEFVQIFNEGTENLVRKLTQECATNKPYVVVNSFISQMTLSAISETSMGAKLEFKTEKEQNYLKAILEIGEIYVYRVVHSWLIFNFVNSFTFSRFREWKLLKILHGFTRDVINEREKNFKLESTEENDDEFSTKKRLAMLDLMLMMKIRDGTIDAAGIQEEVDTFLFEGHDTTGTALCFALLTLAAEKKTQDRIYQELVGVLGDVSNSPSYNDLQQMQYLEMCIKEILRMYPSVPFISRYSGADMVTSTGYKIPKGSLCHVHIYDVHHNPDIYPEPKKFDPDRFLPENCQKRHPFAYIPFSAGPRNCIGQRYAMLEMKAVLCGIIANFVLEPVDTHASIVLLTDIVLRSKDPIKVKFIPRKSSNKNQN